MPGAAPRGGRLRLAVSAAAIALVLVAAGVAALVGRSETPAAGTAAAEAGVPQLIYVWQPG